MLKLRFTKHAEHIVQERNIAEKNMLEAVTKPTVLYYDVASRAMVALKKLDAKHLLVVFVRQNEDIKVVTTFKTSSAQEIMQRKEASGIWLRIR